MNQLFGYWEIQVVPSFLRYVLSKFLFFFEMHLKVITFTSCVYIQPKPYILHLHVVPHKLRWNQCGCEVFFFFLLVKAMFACIRFPIQPFIWCYIIIFKGNLFLAYVTYIKGKYLYFILMFQEWANKTSNVQNQIWFNCSYFWSCHWLSRY